MEDALCQPDARFWASFHIEARGALNATIDGEFGIQPGGVGIYASGTFAGEELHVELMALENGLVELSGEQHYAPHARDAIIVGLTRMGLLHTIARAHAGELPDHAVEGGVRDWVNIDVHSDEPYRMTITVDGEPSGTATLVTDHPYPSERSQDVRLGHGTMHVEETYGPSELHFATY